MGGEQEAGTGLKPQAGPHQAPLPFSLRACKLGAMVRCGEPAAGRPGLSPSFSTFSAQRVIPPSPTPNTPLPARWRPHCGGTGTLAASVVPFCRAPRRREDGCRPEDLGPSPGRAGGLSTRPE